MVSIRKHSTVVFGQNKYTLINNIGNGGNASVWSAKCDSDDREYAIKFLKENVNHNKMKRFQQEIGFCIECDNPHVVKVYAKGLYEGIPCYLMPKYEKTLREVINTESDYLKIFDYIIQICEGVRYIHKKSIIHRDLKPENILIDKGNNAVIADFGIAHFIDSSLTDKNELLCNRYYFAPEQMKGKSKELSAACDIYALGIIINELFTKHRPSGSKMLKIFQVNPILFQLDAIVYSCIKQNPEERPNIEEIYSEIVLIKGELLQALEDIEDYLYICQPKGMPEELIDNIVKKASQDIWIAKSIFDNMSMQDITSINEFYHMDIRYNIDDELINLYFQTVIYKLCLLKFNAEANCYLNGEAYESLDLKNSDHLDIYNKMKRVIEAYRVERKFEEISGKILKLFSSCCDYHCKEILRNVEKYKKSLSDFQRAPILQIVCKLKYELPSDTIEEIDFSNHIYVDWKNTVYDNSVENDLYYYNNHDKDIQGILKEFADKWDVVTPQKDSNCFSIIFKSKEEYSKFKKYALQLSEHHYIFKYDVLYSTRILREYGDFVELIPWSEFEITEVLAKILGLRKDY